MRTTPTTTGRHRYDVAVVGARAAGAATALLLARMGHDVLLLDAAFFPSDTISTHQLARPGVVQLDRWGLLADVLASGAPAIRDVSFTADGETARRTVKDSAGVDLLVAPRRQVIDTLSSTPRSRPVPCWPPASASPTYGGTRPAGSSGCTGWTGPASSCPSLRGS